MRCKMKKVFITSNACRRRLLDASRIQNYLYRNGYVIVKKPEDADLIIFIACSFHNNLADHGLKKVNELKKYDAELIVAGCLPEVEKEKLSKIFNGKTISTKNLNKIDELFPENKIKFSEIEDANLLFENPTPETLAEHIHTTLNSIPHIKNVYIKTRNYIVKSLLGEQSLIYLAFARQPLCHIRTSWGCMGNCSYCTIKKSTGPFHSKPLEDCLKEFKEALKKGYRYFLILGVDVGAYGLDINSSLPELLDEITKIPGDYEIILRGLNPRWLVKYIDDLSEILSRKKIVKIGVSVQSGSSRILKLMNRYPDIEKIKNACIQLKESTPQTSLDTHYIIGFPTETEEDFQETLSFIREIDFNEGYFFRFSSRKGTEAEKIEPKIPEEEITRRIKHARRYLNKLGYNTFFFTRWKFFFYTKKV
ncbi:MAG TPA: radical SAM protein [Thermoplasmatales archaeon]|nr:radical SAM protein [Thermoplasmatales archaeon]